MNQDQMHGMWKELKGKARQKWGQLTDDELDQLEGKREELSGLLQRKYGYAKERADREVEQFYAEHQTTNPLYSSSSGDKGSMGGSGSTRQ
jgi:uncharacterized protein YjbJ (UPF0337 family)